MIGRLAGSVVSDDPSGGLVVDVGGVGYDVLTPIGTRGRAETSSGDVILFVHTHVREDSFELFGFATEADRRVFRHLISVPNVGPKTALGVLSALSTDDLASAVDSGDVARLTRVPGIGKKTAERLVLELKEKLPRTIGDDGRPKTAKPAPPEDARLIQSALTNMGYRPGEAERAVKALGDRVGREPLADLLREALARLTPP